MPSLSQMLVMYTKEFLGALLTSRLYFGMGNRVIDAGSVSGLFFISVVTDAGL